MSAASSNQGVRGQTRRQTRVLIRVISFFFPMLSDRKTLNPPSPVHLKEKYSVVSMKKTVQMFIFYSFKVPVFFVESFGYSFMCKKRAKEDECIWKTKYKKWHHTVQIKTSSLVI